MLDKPYVVEYRVEGISGWGDWTFGDDFVTSENAINYVKNQMVIDSQYAFSTEYRCVLKDGRIFSFDDKGEPVFDSFVSEEKVKTMYRIESRVNIDGRWFDWEEFIGVSDKTYFETREEAQEDVDAERKWDFEYVTGGAKYEYRIVEAPSEVGEDSEEVEHALKVRERLRGFVGDLRGDVERGWETVKSCAESGDVKGERDALVRVRRSEAVLAALEGILHG